jgi:FAD/FMN-containing dehydrogenase
MRSPTRLFSRVRPGDPGWPSNAQWNQLGTDVGGRLLTVSSPLFDCAREPSPPTVARFFNTVKNPYYIRDQVGLTQTLGWIDAWTSSPSVYAVAARNTDDVVAAVNFARENKLRLVVKGAGHSYQGTSNAPDSLLIWTRKMDRITLHDAFVGKGCGDYDVPRPAVSVEAGAIWGQVYDAVTTQAGRYVQGGGCMTVGVAGLVLGGGFGSFSKAFGTAAASLVEAEIVTADGVVRTANRCVEPELFWGLKGGGGGSLGAVTRLTLATHPLPKFFGGVRMRVRAASDESFRRLIGEFVAFYGKSLFNPSWGEQVAFLPGNVLDINMVFQGLDQRQADDTWRPFIDAIAASPRDFSFISPPRIVANLARHWWHPDHLKLVPGLVLADPRPGESDANVFWASNLAEVAMVLHAYQSAWIPASLLCDDQQAELVDALFAATRHWEVVLHLSKGLAGAPRKAVNAAKDTAMNPAVADAFALLICATAGPPAYPGIPDHEPNVATGRAHADAVGRAMTEIRRFLPKVGSYVAESDFFEKNWWDSFWGSNYPKLLAIKNKYDPDGLFFAHHGVGSEYWSADGFTRLR